jgi:NACHT C-terminal Alpha/Beta 2
MTILRTDIEKALNELISNEEGMRFQGLAVVLAKQKWPDLVACERKKDLGLDAYIPASLAKDGIGRGLACSLTATLEKIKSDIDSFRGASKDIGILIFYTPSKVSHQKADNWAKSVHKDYQVELVTVSREDIISDLMVPSNVLLCRSHLGIMVPIEPSITDLIEKAREAISETIAGWLANPRLVGKPRIALKAIKLDGENRETNEILELSSLHSALQEGRRMMLEAPAGRGKTTTLIQLAEQHLAHDELPFLIDLPVWNRTHIDVLEFIASRREFRSRNISAEDLAKLFNTVHCSFLLNGWNEVADTYSENSVQAIRDMERSFTRAGIMVVTRSHHIKPPLLGSIKTKLLPLSRAQRTEYLVERLGVQAPDLTRKLDEDSVLDELTRNPLLLSEVTTLYLSDRDIPRTKIGILSAMTDFLEQSEEHNHHLHQPPLSGHSRDYLAELAAEMTKKGEATIEESQARSIVYSVSYRLNASGQIEQLPAPLSILSGLCAHHVLERLDYSPVIFKFEHQQFQEYLAAIEVKRQLFALSNGDINESEGRFAQEYVNQPAWEEPLRMIAEELGEQTVESSSSMDSVSAGGHLVKMALGIDPIFAGDLARLCGARVWQEVRTAMGKRLRTLYANGSAYNRRWALGGMLATGSEDFKDILVPLLIDDNQQVRLETYRVVEEFHITCLGGNWRSTVGGWGEAQRADFVREVVSERRMAQIAEDFARSDPSPNVRAAALHALRWIGANMALAKVLEESDSRTFEHALMERLMDPLPIPLHERALSTFQTLLQRTADPVARLRTRLAYLKIEPDDGVEGVKRDLSEWPTQRNSDVEFWLLKPALELVKKADPNWVSDWVVQHILNGTLWAEDWIRLVLEIPESLTVSLVEKICHEKLEYSEKNRIISVLTATANTQLVETIFNRMCELRSLMPTGSPESQQFHKTIFNQLEKLCRELPPKMVVSGLLPVISPKPDLVQASVVTEIIQRIGDQDSDLRNDLPDKIRQPLRNYLKEIVPFYLAQQDYDGEQKGYLGLALGRVGDPEDIVDLMQLIRVDLERVRKGREARLQGLDNPLAREAINSWTLGYVQAVISLDPNKADEILLELLNEQEYEEVASAELVRLAKFETKEKHFEFERLDYRLVWDARINQHAFGFIEDRRCRYSEAIKQRIKFVQEDQSRSDKPESFHHRLKTLANRLAQLDGYHSVDFVLDILALPAQSDRWIRINAIESLLRSGAGLPADSVFRVLDPTIDYILTNERYNQDSLNLLGRCLSLFPFIDPASKGINRIKEINPTKWLHYYNLQELIKALGQSRCEEALELLIEMAKSEGHRMEGSVVGEWLDALTSLDIPESKLALLSFVDPFIDNLGVSLKLDYYYQERLTSRIADLARADPTTRDRLYKLCTMPLDPQARLLLADSVTQIGAPGCLVAGLSLIRDNASPPVPPALMKNLEAVFVQRHPFGNSGNSYSLEPQSANQIRSHIFAMALTDDARKFSAWRILEEIESWRLEYGRPNSEPRHPDIDSGIPWPQQIS